VIDTKQMAHEYAVEMVEHNLKNGATELDVDFIAKQACELAYAIEKYGEFSKPVSETKPL
jgi:hypothetical protein